MKKLIYPALILASYALSNSAFAATANCVATNAKTGQSFSANGGGPDQAQANQVAQDKALGKCHAESVGWPGQCAITECN